MRAAGLALKPGTLESRNCSSYSGGFCLTKTLYKRSHFTKTARVSLTSPSDRINKRGDNNKPRRGRGSRKQGFLQKTLEKAKANGPRDRGSAVRGLQALPSSQGLWNPGTAAAILEGWGFIKRTLTLKGSPKKVTMETIGRACLGIQNRPFYWILPSD